MPAADSPLQVVVAGGGAAGFFGAIAAAENGAKVTLLEKGPRFLSKVRISGGGRCNVTHACFEPGQMAERYPRGQRALLAPFHRFQASDTVEWFADRGVTLKTEPDGRMFPISDSSETIVECLMQAAADAGVVLRTAAGLKSIRREAAEFELELVGGERLAADRVLLATGGCRAAEVGPLLEPLGHCLAAPPVPSLFTLEVPVPWVREISGLAVEARVSVPGTRLAERGPVLFTHWGLSGPAILRLSAWGARILHELKYQFPLTINWLPNETAESILGALQNCRQTQPGRLVRGSPLLAVPFRLWEKLVQLAGVENGVTWNRLPREQALRLVQLLGRTELPVTGKSLNKDEFVTCGGVHLPEVDLRTMESRKCPGLFFAGEILDIDGITGGYNFQAAWTTGWLAGQAMTGAGSGHQRLPKGDAQSGSRAGHQRRIDQKRA